jgi:O-acetyl-ADP-ribose deacetylase (regulator of RNase III)
VTPFQRIAIVEADITTLGVDAIVNAANESLLGGGGVDGAIHRAAGPELYEECRRLNGCATGDAKITKGYRLRAKFIIHAVGPVYYDGKRGEADKLASCYRRSLEVARDHGLTRIAFPSISTGIYGYPLRPAAHASIEAIVTHLAANELPERVILCTFDEDTTEVTTAVYDELKAKPAPR